MEQHLKNDTLISRSHHRFSEVLGDVIDKLTSSPSPKITTGLRDLDSILRGGLSSGSISAVAARPSMGREEFAMHVAFRAAKQGYGVIYFSFERPRHAIALYALADLLDVDSGWWRSQHSQAESLEPLKKHSSALASLSELPIVIDDTPSLKPQELCDRGVALCRSEAFSDVPARLLIIDSLAHLFSSPMPLADQIKSTMTMLTELAATENVHILCTVPVLHQVDERESHRPRLFDLWGDGMVERFCEPVIAIYRDSYYYPPSQLDDPDLAQVLVLRNSALGATGMVMTSFDKRRFGEMNVNLSS